MSLHFTECPRPTVGVEIEAQLIDPSTHDLAPVAVPVVAAAATEPDLHVSAELSVAMVEVKTEICDSVAAVGTSLRRQIAVLREIAADAGAQIAIAGTHPFQDWRERRIYPKERYVQILEKYQWLARRWTTFGMHIHVGIRNGERAISIMNALIAYLPHLVALSASSPFWGGTDTGLASSRSAVIESFPTGGLPYFLKDWSEFEKYFETLVAAGAIGSMKDIYWDIRPQLEYGSIEVRVCDGIPNMRETLAIVALVHCLIVWIDDQMDKGGRTPHIRMQRYWTAPENKWQAVRYGLDGQLIMADGNSRRPIRDEIDKLVEILQPTAAALQCTTELAGIREILRHGPSATRQRAVYANTHTLTAVVEALIAELARDDA